MSIRRPDKREALTEDLLVCLEYAAAFDPRYRAPTLNEAPQAPPTVTQQLKAKKQRKQEQSRQQARRHPQRW